MAEPLILLFLSSLLKMQDSYRQNRFNDTLRQAMRTRINSEDRYYKTPKDSPEYINYLESKLMNSANSEEEYSNPRDFEVRLHYLEKEVKELWSRLRAMRVSRGLTLSDLPDSLITQILLYLPTKDSIKTRLELHSHGLSDSVSIKNFIHRFLEINRDSRLPKFKIKYDVCNNVYLFGISKLIAEVINRGVHQLDVGTPNRPFTKDLMPLDVYKSNTLVSLTLANVGMASPQFDVSLPCLKTMHLEDVMYSHEDPLFIEKLISGCPVLEDLTVCRVFDDNVPVLRVRSQCLKRFCVKFGRDRKIFGKEYAVEIDAPGLKYMNFRDDLSDRVVVKNLSSLVKIDIDTQFGTGTLQMKKAIISDFLTGVSNVRHMIISQPTLEVLYSCMKQGPFPKFRNLTRLEASFCTVLLKNCHIFLKYLLYLKDLEPENLELTVVPYCLLCTLECVEVKEVTTVENVGKKRASVLEISEALPTFTGFDDNVPVLRVRSQSLKRFCVKFDRSRRILEEYSNPRDFEVRLHYLEKEVKELWSRLRAMRVSRGLTLSDLPDSLITQILLYLPTKDSIKTSFLSKRFRDLWLQVPGLELNSHDLPAIKNFIYRFLEVNRNSRLRKIKIKYDDECNNVYLFRISKLMAKVINRGVHQVDIGTLESPLTKDLMCVEIYKSKSLVSLKLENLRIMPNRQFGVSLPCLKTMHLEDIITKDPLIIEKFISGCPVLEDLNVCRVFDDNVPVLRVRSQSLKRFCVKFDRSRRIFGKEYAVEIDAPGLKYLNFRDDHSDIVVAKNLSSLFKVDIDTQFSGTTSTLQMKKAMISGFLTGISSVRHMIISQPTLEVLCYCMKEGPFTKFCNLSRLEASFCTVLLQMLPRFLEGCPNLKHLKLHLLYLKDLEPENLELTVVPYCLLCTLECVEVKEVTTVENVGKKRARYIKRTKVSKHKKKIWTEVVRYILENSLVLKKLVLRFSHVTNSVLEISEALPTNVILQRGLTQRFDTTRLPVYINYLESKLMISANSEEEYSNPRDLEIRLHYLRKEVKECWTHRSRGLSSLPDSLIAQILLCLPTKDSVKTSILSTRFRILWLQVPGLELHSHDFSDPPAIKNFIDRFLHINRESRLQKFKIKYDECNVYLFGISELISQVINRGVHQLDVGTLNRPFTKDVMPLDVYKSNSLVSLKLANVGMASPQFAAVSLPCLKTMHLEAILTMDPLIIEKLLSGCPVLEDLTVFRAVNDNVPVLRVRSQSLKRFCVKFGRYRRIFGKDVLLGTTSTLQMKKAIISDFLTGVSSVGHMIISQLTLEVLYACMEHGPFTKFRNLTRLEASFCTVLLQNLPHFLEGFPKLKHLTLHLLYLKDLEPENLELTVVPQCFLCTLECVEVKEVATVENAGKKRARYIKRTKVSKHKKKIWTEVVRYILENSLVLKKLVLCFSHVTNSFLEISEALPTFTIRSPGCEIFNHLTSL
ncbi:hypothetical protein Bca52824_015277 [Brassica carinata]|uniref:F-box domain-containing protein n=1 Tax=Brassica carinata TaxID=52824 RepID=A0A8X7W1Q5_BRACI|nr:hypothetical protein Bca52824_015277 [Brassica carinata]